MRYVLYGLMRPAPIFCVRYRSFWPGLDAECFTVPPPLIGVSLGPISQRSVIRRAEIRGQGRFAYFLFHDWYMIPARKPHIMPDVARFLATCESSRNWFEISSRLFCGKMIGFRNFNRFCFCFFPSFPNLTFRRVTRNLMRRAKWQIVYGIPPIRITVVFKRFWTQESFVLHHLSLFWSNCSTFNHFFTKYAPLPALSTRVRPCENCPALLPEIYLIILFHDRCETQFFLKRTASCPQFTDLIKLSWFFVKQKSGRNLFSAHINQYCPFVK